MTVDDLGVDLLRHRHERHLAVQLDQREPGRAGGVHDRGRQPAEARTELHHERGDAAVGQPADERPLLGGAGAEAQAGGEEQLAALEQRRDVGNLARVHPAHGAAEPVGAGHHLGESAAQPGQLKGSLHGDAALGLHWLWPRASRRSDRAVARFAVAPGQEGTGPERRRLRRGRGPLTGPEPAAVSHFLPPVRAGGRMGAEGRKR